MSERAVTRRRVPAAALAAFVLGASGGLLACDGTGSPSVTLDAGTRIQADLQQELSTRNNSEGDEFSATVAASVTRGDTVVVPSGAVLHGTVTAVQSRSEDAAAVLTVDFTSLEVRGEERPISARLVSANPEERSNSSTAEDAARVGLSAAAGAILGKVVTGEDEGVVVGGAAGAAAGTAIVLGNRESWAVLPAGSRITVELTGPHQVPVPADSL